MGGTVAGRQLQASETAVEAKLIIIIIFFFSLVRPTPARTTSGQLGCFVGVRGLVGCLAVTAAGAVF